MFSSDFHDGRRGRLADYVTKCTQIYYGLSIVELRKLAFQFGEKIGVSFPEAWKENAMAGKDWYYAFMKRHPNLSLRTPEQTSLNRVKSFCRENVSSFFAQLQQLCTEYNFSPENIWNMDETGLSTVPTKVGKVISMRGVKKVGKNILQITMCYVDTK